MIQKKGGLIVLFTLIAAKAAVSQPTVTPVSVEQVDGTRQVRICYELTHSEGLGCTVSVTASRDGGTTFLELNGLTGDCGPNVTPGSGKEIIWQAAEDWPAEQYAGVIVRLKASGGPGGSTGSELVEVPGGDVKMGFNTIAVDSFYIGKYEVTWGEWQEVRTWAAGSGYDIGEAGQGCESDHPVNWISWYDALKWCNALSEKTGRMPVYTIAGSTYKTGEINPEQNLGANGFRLPLEAEWQFAAGGGNLTHGYTYSGSDDLDAVGWYGDNSDGAACDMTSHQGTWPVGLKAPNELGLYDMSGNVSEWTWDTPSYSDAYRRHRGGYWGNADFNCEVTFDNDRRPDYVSLSTGLRLSSNAPGQGSSGSDYADFVAFNLDLSGNEPVWHESPWYGWFYNLDASWIWHVEHGCQYCISGNVEDTASIFFYDLGIQSWMWTCTRLYPFIFKFGANEGWYWYFTGGSPGSRWFARVADDAYVQETTINDPIMEEPPEGFSHIPAGSFQMGDSMGEGMLNEFPVHEVYVSGFYVQQTEVTNSQIVDVLNWALDQGLAGATTTTVVNLAGPEEELLDLDSESARITLMGTELKVSGGYENVPCAIVSWYGAMAYCHYLTRKEGGLEQAINLEDWSFNISANGYRLPTEAEWEKAARGGLEGKRYPWGDEINATLASYHFSTSGISPVAQYPENGYGLFDTCGNVWEWCADFHGDEYYAISPMNNPTGPSSGLMHAVRGGNWTMDSFFCRVAYRGRSGIGIRLFELGLRPVRSQ